MRNFLNADIKLRDLGLWPDWFFSWAWPMLSVGLLLRLYFKNQHL